VLIFVFFLAVGRFRFLNDTQVDRMINRTLLVSLVTNLSREVWVQKLIAKALFMFDEANVINIVRQLSFGGILLAVAYIYGMAKMWGGTSPETARQRQPIYNLVAVAATVVILVAGTPARQRNLLIDQALGWGAVVAWTAFYIPIIAVAVLVGRVCAREFRTHDVTVRERAIYAGVLVLVVGLGADAIATPVMTAYDVISGTPSRDPEMVLKAWTFFLSAAISSTVIAVPLVSVLTARAGLDRTARYCRRLQPLWHDLTAAAPEIVLRRPDSPEHVESATRLHRMIVEIRDSLLVLKQFSTDDIDLGDPDAQRNRGDDDELMSYAVRVAQAAEAKTRGDAPTGGAVRRDVRPRARDLTAELEQLAALARVWPQARRLAEARQPTQS
ncbi:MAG: MAB_1171c family putative transporter, partial [Candidatus Nanopelagicales bacterium]